MPWMFQVIPTVKLYVSLKSIWTLRKHLTEDGLYVEMFEKATEKLAKIFKVDFDKQRLDSVHIQSNMRHLGRIALFSRTIKKFLLNFKKATPCFV